MHTTVTTEGVWRVCMDTGGTFTDVVAVAPGGQPHRLKILSSGRVRGRLVNGRFEARVPANLLSGAEIRRVRDERSQGRITDTGAVALLEPDPPDTAVDVVPELDAPLLGLHLVTGTRLGDPLPRIDLRLATTRSTNALLEDQLGRVLLVTTEGLADLPVIGDQSRPDLFALEVRPRRLPPTSVLECPRHLDAGGEPASILDPREIAERACREIDRLSIDAVAVALLHSWRAPEVERSVAAAIRTLRPDVPVSCGVDVSPGIRLVPRVRTTIADAALAPVMQRFLRELSGEDRPVRTLVSSSSAGLVPAERVRPCETLLSGPAAGVLGAVAAVRGLSEPVVAFDMGGTSTDVARADRRMDLKDQTEVGTAVVRVPSVDLHTVAAGGGSICRIEDRRLVVGPESAGAAPGPACYGGGGPLTITDVNLLLGRADPARFGVPLDLEAAEQAADALARDHARDRTPLLRGFADLADERMAEAIRAITTRRGVDPADHALVAFGGAGGQHACGVASRLGITRIVVPSDAGLLSAVGLGRAVRERSIERSIVSTLAESLPPRHLDEVEHEALEAAKAAGCADPIVRRRQWRCRLLGQDSTIDLEFDDPGSARSASEITRRFHEAFERLHGHAVPDRELELAAVRVFAGDAEVVELDLGPAPEAPLAAGTRTAGPALLPFDSGTVWVAEGWTAEGLPDGSVSITRPSGPRFDAIDGPAATEIVACRLESIARDMGETLRRTALSVNVKERLDYSCGIVDREGRLVVNAPHMPVHLGAMGDCVRRVLEVLDPSPGDSILVNHPAFGGSHLPDLTVITPVHAPDGDRIGFVVNRAHHAEIGGIRPGSMPPDARRLVDEGVAIEPMLVARDGVPCLEEVARRLREAPHPSRAVAENLADLSAQLAANRLGASRLAAIHDAVGATRFDDDLDALRARCAAAIGGLAERLEGVDRSVHDRLDDGTPLVVRLRGRAGRIEIDFEGTGDVHPGNLNAPLAVARAAVLYVLRVVAGEPIPLNEGVLEVVDLRCPTGLLSPPFTGDPRRDPAVAIGNTETSQRVVDVLLEAFGAVAGSQGTMNNLLLGDDTFGYYETICGGTGAGPGFHGASAVHSHMTNTRITDPEMLETRYPVRLDGFGIRRDSGGVGRFRGGDGAVRSLTALAPLRGSLLGQHRTAGPRGLEGGDDGRPAVARVRRADGTTEPLPGIAAFDLSPGDRLEIETPGGGGCGPVSRGTGTG